MKYILPKALNIGDTIQFIAPAGCIIEKEPIINAKSFFENMGYKVRFSKNLFGKFNYLSGSDDERLEDLHNAFLDSSVDAIICARGGYGSLRLIEHIDYNLIKSNPKIFCGYSDITVLSLLFLKKSNLITYTSPMAKGDFGAETVSQFTMNNFFKALSSNEILSFMATDCYNSADTKGILWGGNLSSVVSLCGLDIFPDEKFIFLAEDLNEPVYKIDKMFTQMFLNQTFKNNVSALVLGDFLDSGYPEQLDEFFKYIALKHNIPVLRGIKLTHNKDKITLPIGKMANIKDNVLIVE